METRRFALRREGGRHDAYGTTDRWPLTKLYRFALVPARWRAHFEEKQKARASHESPGHVGAIREIVKHLRVRAVAALRMWPYFGI